MILFPIVGILAILVAVIAMMAISFSFNALLGNRQESSPPSERRWRLVWLAAVPALGLIALLGAFSTNTVRIQTPADEEHAANSDQSRVEGLSEARFELQKTRRALAGIVAINEADFPEPEADTEPRADESAKPA